MIVPVIHCISWSQIKYNLDICQRNGVEMVFLINHGSIHPVHNLVSWLTNAKKEYPNIKFGVNFLQLKTEEAIMMANQYNADAIWTDYQGTGDRECPLFGAVAFKYQKHVPDDQLESVCKEAMKVMDVITTSGPATGKPASIQKIEKMRSYIGDFPLAIASGVNVENKKLFEPLVDYMLVASSITDNNEMIIESKLIELINA
jgi:predicted TIM-barrel enzyme